MKNYYVQKKTYGLVVSDASHILVMGLNPSIINDYNYKDELVE